MTKSLGYRPSDLLQAVIQSPVPHHVITFYGREPLLSLDFIRDCFKEIPEKIDGPPPKRVDFALITNGLLLDNLSSEEISRFRLIIVSFNGLSHFHDIERGVGSYDKVLSNIKQIRSHVEGILEGRLVVTENVDINVAVTSMLNTFDTIHWSLVEDGNVSSYSTFIENYCQQIERLYYLWLKELQNGKVHNIIPFVGAVMNRIKDERYDRLLCGAGFNSVSVGLDGSYFKCIDCIGRRAISSEHQSGSLWEGFNPGNGIPKRQECRKCRLIEWCGGRCMWTPSRSYCKSTRFMLNLVHQSINEITAMLKEGVFSLEDFDEFVIEYEEVIP